MSTDNTCVFNTADISNDTISMLPGPGHDPMLSISKDGFWVRGVKVPQDEKEAQTVYNAFLEWMTYVALTRNY